MRNLLAIGTGLALFSPVPVESLSLMPCTGVQDHYVATEMEHNVQEGDTLWGIAQTFYGSPLRFEEIAKANHIENPNKIYAGDTLTLPGLIDGSEFLARKVRLAGYDLCRVGQRYNLQTIRHPVGTTLEDIQ